MKHSEVLLAGLVTFGAVFAGRADTSVAAYAVNALGIDLLQQTASADANALLSPYSIQSAMAMACAGADGETREEMAGVLHYPTNETRVDASFGALRVELADAGRERGVTLTTANRLYGQSGYDFRRSYLNLLETVYRAPFETCDFKHSAPAATKEINSWVEQETANRIQNLIPAGALGKTTRLVLVNAIYMKAPWKNPFETQNTEPEPFNLTDGTVPPVPTMVHQASLGYTHFDGYSAVVLPYAGTDLQFVILLPDVTNGLAALEANLQPEMLAECTNLPVAEVVLHLPKFELQPPVLSLSSAMESLGMSNAFNLPAGSADFDRIAPITPDDYLYISDIFHKTFIQVDEGGTEAAAATAVVVVTATAVPGPPLDPVEIRVDHPFLFAIQHRSSGACLFLGQVTDPQCRARLSLPVRGCPSEG